MEQTNPEIMVKRCPGITHPQPKIAHGAGPYEITAEFAEEVPLQVKKLSQGVGREFRDMIENGYDVGNDSLSVTEMGMRPKNHIRPCFNLLFNGLEGMKSVRIVGGKKSQPLPGNQLQTAIKIPPLLQIPLVAME
jgi:hypothetical protein